MKLTFLLTVINVFLVSAAGYTQTARLTLNLKDATLKQVFSEIENKTNFSFLYKADDINPNQKVNIVASNTSIEDVLNSLFADKNVQYKILDNSLIVLLPVRSQQQQQTHITGTVTDANTGEALPGVSIAIEGTTMGSITDIDGKFVLDASDPNATLVFSYVGYRTEKVALQGRSLVDVKLAPDVQSLDELVVVGYGSQRRRLVTGSTVDIKGGQLQQLSTTNAFQALQGLTPGMNITSTSGQPGSGFKVVVRGVGSLTSTSPLFIVDGVQTSDISYLNNSDIESVDILKDAASTAIYGSQAANGVVLITTRQGRAGKAQITFDGFAGSQKVMDKVRTLNSREYATIMNEQAVNSGKLPYFSNHVIDSLSNHSTDWIGTMLKDNVPTQNYSLGISGGNESSIYSSALSYAQQGGIVGGKQWSNYERYGFRFNSEHKLYKNVVTFGEHLTFTYINSNGIDVGGQYSNTLRGAFNANPFIPVYDTLGNFFDNSNSSWNNGATNPYANMVYNNQNQTNNQKLLGDIYMEIAPVKNLTYRTTLGIEYNAGKYHRYRPTYRLSIYDFNDSSSVTQTMFNNFFWIWDNLVTYRLVVNQHQIDVMAGMSAQRNSGANINGTNANASFSGLDYAYLNNTTYANGPLMTLGGTPFENMMASYFGRVSYNYKETYMLNAVLRADGSSRFASGHRWGVFPSISAGWTLTNEAFLQNIKNTVNFLKVRASWGQNGNQNITDNNYETLVSLSNAQYIFGPTEGKNTPGAYPSQLGNPNIKWETAEQIDLGLDAVFINNKLSANFDWYKKTNKNWLVPAPILATAGANPPYINGGNVENKGVEVALNWSDKIGKLTYTVGANVAYNKNVVKNVPTGDGIIHGGLNELWNNSPEFYRAQTGYPVGYFWGYKTLGVFQNTAEINAYTNNSGGLIQPNAQPGDLKFFDANGDGQISSLDKIKVGDPNPHYTFGFNISLNYQGFDFLVLANGVAGNQLVQSYRNSTDQNANYLVTILDRWHGEGSSNKIPRLTEDGRNFTDFSDIYVQNGDFLRISNITLGYDFSKILKLKAISQMRLYVAAENLITFTKYTGMDPELGYGNSVTSGVNGIPLNFSYGIDYGFYPHPTTLLVGFNIKF